MTKIGSYKGNPTITLNAEGKFPFTFGLAKAKLVLGNIDAIRKFVSENEESKGDRFDQDNEDRNAARLALGGGQ